jgi:hypothetical protein
MNKIGTHNSATGMKGKGWLSWLVTPFVIHFEQQKEMLFLGFFLWYAIE